MHRAKSAQVASLPSEAAMLGVHSEAALPSRDEERKVRAQPNKGFVLLHRRPRHTPGLATTARSSGSQSHTRRDGERSARSAVVRLEPGDEGDKKFRWP